MPVEDSTTIRRTIHYSGHVQGVGFRYTTKATAARFRVTGFVRNLADGRVELVVEAESAEVDRFQAAVLAAMKGHIHDVAVAESPATGKFTSFSIVR